MVLRRPRRRPLWSSDTKWDGWRDERDLAWSHGPAPRPRSPELQSGLRLSQSSSGEPLLLQRLDFIQGARGVAALAVVLWHASRYLGPYGSGLGGALFHPAVTMGVDLFFILSGFIMVVTTQSNDGSIGYALQFMVKRLTRIWPTYAVAMLVTVVLLRWEALEAGLWMQVARALVFLPIGPAGDSNIPPLFGVPPLAVGWTLTYEMYFYLLFGVSLLFGKLRWVALALWAAVTLILLPYTTVKHFTFYSAFIPEYRQPYTSYLDLIENPIIYLFFAGAAIGALYLSPLRVGSIFYARLLVLLASTLVIWQYSSHSFLWHGALGAGASLIPAMAILCLVSKTVQVSCPAWLVGLGGISYSLYLWHPLVQTGFDRVVNALGRPDLAAGFPPLVTTTLLSIAVAAISQRYLEQGLSNAIRRGLVHSGKARAQVEGQFVER